MMISLLGWIFLAVAALFMGMGLFGMLARTERFATWKECPYTGESVANAARWLGLSAFVTGLGIAGFVLLTGVLFQIGPFRCTVGLVTLLGFMGLSRTVALKAYEMLEKKARLTVLKHEDADDTHSDDDDHFDDDDFGDMGDQMAA